MEKKIAGRTAEQWRDYARKAIDAKRKAIADAQDAMRKERMCTA